MRWPYMWNMFFGTRWGVDDQWFEWLWIHDVYMLLKREAGRRVHVSSASAEWLRCVMLVSVSVVNQGYVSICWWDNCREGWIIHLVQVKVLDVSSSIIPVGMCSRHLISCCFPFPPLSSFHLFCLPVCRFISFPLHLAFCQQNEKLYNMTLLLSFVKPQQYILKNEDA